MRLTKSIKSILYPADMLNSMFDAGNQLCIVCKHVNKIIYTIWFPADLLKNIYDAGYQLCIGCSYSATKISGCHAIDVCRSGSVSRPMYLFHKFWIYESSTCIWRHFLRQGALHDINLNTTSAILIISTMFWHTHFLCKPVKFYGKK